MTVFKVYNVAVDGAILEIEISQAVAPSTVPTVTPAAPVPVTLVIDSSTCCQSIILCHGLASNRLMLKELAATLVSEYGYSVCLIDLRGHGNSSLHAVGNDNFTLKQNCSDVIAVIEYIRGHVDNIDTAWMQPILLAGHSYGANVVVEVAASAMSADYVKGIICIDGGFINLKSVYADYQQCEENLIPPSFDGMTKKQLYKEMTQKWCVGWSEYATDAMMNSFMTLKTFNYTTYYPAKVPLATLYHGSSSSSSSSSGGYSTCINSISSSSGISAGSTSSTNNAVSSSVSCGSAISISNAAVDDDGDCFVAPKLSLQRHLCILKDLYNNPPSLLYSKVRVPILFLVAGDGGKSFFSNNKLDDIDVAIQSCHVPVKYVLFPDSGHDLPAIFPIDTASTIHTYIASDYFNVML